MRTETIKQEHIKCLALKILNYIDDNPSVLHTNPQLIKYFKSQETWIALKYLRNNNLVYHHKINKNHLYYWSKNK